MANEEPTNKAWRLVNGRWVRSFGERGCRIRIFQHTTGKFYRDVWVRGKGKDRKCLHTEKKDEAERLGRALLRKLLGGPATMTIEPAPATVAPTGRTLLSLVERYKAECPSHLGLNDVLRDTAEMRMNLLLAFFGETQGVDDLTKDDLTRYLAKRRGGGIVREDGKVTGAVRARSLQGDFDVLNDICKWALRTRGPSGGKLLELNPLDAMPRPADRDPRQPTATDERYFSTRQAMRELASVRPKGRSRIAEDWLRMEMALILAARTGRRVGAIRKLRWEDFDWARGVVRWRAATDKKRRERWLPLPADLAVELRGFQRQLGAVGGLVFPSDTNAERPMHHTIFHKALDQAEQHAQLPPLDGSSWHAYRRFWATARKHLPVKDVAEAGGWKDVKMVLRYQQATEDEVRAVMESVQPVRRPVRNG